jgi:plastocyanin
MRLKRGAAVGALFALALAVALPASATAAAGGTTLAIGVGHTDPDNQQFSVATLGPVPGGRVWSYTDFFTREVWINSGDTLDFQTPPNEFHVVALTKDGPGYRAANPIFRPDNEPPPETSDPVAPGSGVAKVLLAPSGLTLFNPPTCGVKLAGQPNCIFDGATTVTAGPIGGGHIKKLLQVFGQLAVAPPPLKKITPALFNGTVDWNVTVTAGPGDYNYLCLIHPDMNGTLHVVAAGAPTTAQGTINAQSLAQFAADKAEGQARYAADNTPTVESIDASGHKTWSAHAGDNTDSGHVAFFEMMPRNLNLSVGDSVHWTWGTEAELHTVSFPANTATLPPPFMPDCGFSPGTDDFFLAGPTPAQSYCGDLPPSFENFELAGDPGNARPGILSNTTDLVDSGVLVGAHYNLSPSVQDWTTTAAAPSTSAAPASTPVTHFYQCTLHDWMQAAITVG